LPIDLELLGAEYPICGGSKCFLGSQKTNRVGELGKPVEACAWCKPMQVRGSYSICFSRSWPKPRVILWEIALCLVKVIVVPVTAGCGVWKGKAVEAKLRVAAQGVGLQVTHHEGQILCTSRNGATPKYRTADGFQKALW